MDGENRSKENTVATTAFCAVLDWSFEDGKPYFSSIESCLEKFFSTQHPSLGVVLETSPDVRLGKNFSFSTFDRTCSKDGFQVETIDGIIRVEYSLNDFFTKPGAVAPSLGKRVVMYLSTQPENLLKNIFTKPMNYRFSIEYKSSDV